MATPLNGFKMVHAWETHGNSGMNGVDVPLPCLIPGPPRSWLRSWWYSLLSLMFLALKPDQQGRIGFWCWSCAFSFQLGCIGCTWFRPSEFRKFHCIRPGLVFPAWLSAETSCSWGASVHGWTGGIQSVCCWQYHCGSSRSAGWRQGRKCMKWMSILDDGCWNIAEISWPSRAKRYT